MRRKILDVLFDDRGYVTALTLIAMPMLLGFSLLVIDVSRGNNLHTDLQNAVDGLALAGARELDGRTDSITRANAALAALVKNQARGGNSGAAIIDNTQVSAIYLDTIPVSDDTRIDSAWITAHQTTNGTQAVYLLVRSTPRAMTSLFPIPVGLTRSTVNFQAEAVAVYDASACDITPMFICNPFEAQGLSLPDAFKQGLTYGREILSLQAGATPGAGNFGLLDTDMDLRESFGKGAAGACYSKRSVVTKTGVNFGPVYAGINVRFDVYANSINKPQYKNDPLWRPSINVRKGASKSSNCSKFASDDVVANAMGFPLGNNYNSSTGMTDSTWSQSRDLYWKTNHPQSTMPAIPSATNPLGTSFPPSRYDVYKYEIDNNLINETGIGKNKETGAVACHDPSSVTKLPDRRVIFAAIVNCHDFQDSTKHSTINGKTTLKPDSFASVFLTNPVEKTDKSDVESSTGSVKPITFEIVDVTGGQGNGSLDQFMREESYLVR